MHHPRAEQRRPQPALRRRQAGLRRRRSTTCRSRAPTDIATTQTEIKSKLQADKSYDAVMALNPDIANAAATAIKGASSRRQARHVRPQPGRSSSASRHGTIAFAVDQQQYLQGYLPIVFLKLFKTNANTVGGGQPVLTGPGFVDKSNVDDGREARGRRHAMSRADRPAPAPAPTPAPVADERLANIGLDGAHPAPPGDRRAAGRDRRRRSSSGRRTRCSCSSTASPTGPTWRRRSASRR